MSNTNPGGAQFEIKVGDVTRTFRDQRVSAIQAAQFLQARNPGAKITVTNLRDGSDVPFEAR